MERYPKRSAEPFERDKERDCELTGTQKYPYPPGVACGSGVAVCFMGLWVQGLC